MTALIVVGVCAMRGDQQNKVFAALSADPALAAKLGKACGIGRNAVCMWPNKVPAKHVLKVAEFMGLHPSEVRADLYPVDFSRRFAIARR
jgi:hypothetical protein